MKMVFGRIEAFAPLLTFFKMISEETPCVMSFPRLESMESILETKHLPNSQEYFLGHLGQIN